MTAGRLAAVLAPLLLARAAQPAPADKPPGGWKVEPFKVESRSKGFELRLSGYVQADFRDFRDWQVGDGSDPSLRAPESEWRRLRIGFEGEWGRLGFELDVDPAFAKGDELKDARLTLRFARALRASGGHLKLPASPEWLTSAAKTDFIERSAAVDALAPGRDWGGMLHGELGRSLEWSAGLFEGDDRSSSRRAGTTAAGRLVLKPARWLELGGSASQGDVVEAPPDAPEPTPKGVRGTSGSGYLFFPGVHVNGRRRRWGADARLESGPVSIWGEFVEAREQRIAQGPSLEDLPDVYGRGWSATATWLVTGDRKVRTMKPDRGLPGGPGAVELSARIEALWFDDVADEGFESAGSRARNVRPAGIRTFTAGLSWWPTSFLRFQGNALVERYDDALRAPQPGRSGDYLTLSGRLQVHLP